MIAAADINISKIEKSKLNDINLKSWVGLLVSLADTKLYAEAPVVFVINILGCNGFGS